MWNYNKQQEGFVMIEVKTEIDMTKLWKNLTPELLIKWVRHLAKENISSNLMSLQYFLSNPFSGAKVDDNDEPSATKDAMNINKILGIIGAEGAVALTLDEAEFFVPFIEISAKHEGKKLEDIWSVEQVDDVVFINTTNGNHHIRNTKSNDPIAEENIALGHMHAVSEHVKGGKSNKNDFYEATSPDYIISLLPSYARNILPTKASQLKKDITDDKRNLLDKGLDSIAKSYDYVINELKTRDFDKLKEILQEATLFMEVGENAELKNIVEFVVLDKAETAEELQAQMVKFIPENSFEIVEEDGKLSVKYEYNKYENSYKSRVSGFKNTLLNKGGDAAVKYLDGLSNKIEQESKSIDGFDAQEPSSTVREPSEAQKLAKTFRQEKDKVIGSLEPIVALDKLVKRVNNAPAGQDYYRSSDGDLGLHCSTEKEAEKFKNDLEAIGNVTVNVIERAGQTKKDIQYFVEITDSTKNHINEKWNPVAEALEAVVEADNIDDVNTYSDLAIDSFKEAVGENTALLSKTAKIREV